MSKISKLVYTPKPLANQFEFTVFTQDIDFTFELVILQIGDSFFYPTANENEHRCNVTSMILPMIKGNVPTKLNAKVYLYNFKKDENIDVEQGELTLYNVDFTQDMAAKEAVLSTVSDLTQPWVKDLSVSEVKGPFQNGHEVQEIDTSIPVSYIAFVDGKRLNRAQFLSVKWSYAVAGGAKNRFNHPMEWVNDWVDDHVFMQCNMLTEWAGKEISVYAFFKGESEQVVSRKVAKTSGATTSTVTSPSSNPQVIFPLLVKPENDPGNKWGTSYHWAGLQRQNMATFNSDRSGGRRHAGRDLYTNPKETVVAMCDGEVLQVNAFYARTDQITILHKTKDGRKFIIRYGELAPSTITLKVGDKVVQKQKLGETGKLLKPSSQPLLTIGGTIVYMLHFELYSGAEGFNLNKPLTASSGSFQRRSDLLDALSLLQEGYKNSFGGATVSPVTAPSVGRKAIKDLATSQKGLDFIKSWESFRKNAYNDSEGFCTIGYGHLIAKKKCEDLTLSPEFKNGISESKAAELMQGKIQEFEISLKRDITVPLFQHEFDALMSLVYNVGPNFLRTGGSGGGPTKIMKNINNGAYADGAKEFSDITNGGVLGLVNRRKAEIEIFLNKKYVNH